MSTGRSRGVRAAALLAAAALSVATWWPAHSGAAAQSGAATLSSFTPESGGFSLHAAAPPLPHPNGDLFFVLAANRLLCTADAETGAYVAALDLGLEVAAALAREPRAPMTISKDGRVLALPAAGAVRFFDVERTGRVTPRSQFPAATGSAVEAGLSADGETAVFAYGPSPAAVATVRTRDAKLLDSIPLSSDEAPLETGYSPDRGALSVVTAHGVLLFLHSATGKLKQTGVYRREGFAGDAFSGLEALGKGGRVVFTIEQGGAALVGVSLKGKQTARAPSRLPDRFSAPVAASPDGSAVAAVSVSGTTGAPVAIMLFAATGRGLKKGQPKTVAVDDGLGPVGRLEFDPAGALLAASFPASGTVLLVDAAAGRVVGETRAVGSAEGLAFGPDSRSLLVAGSPTALPAASLGAGAVTVFPVSRRGIEEAGAVRFARLPGVIFGAGDRAIGFGQKFYAVAGSGADDAVYSFFAHSGNLIERLDVGASMGLVAAAPDGRTLVASGDGGVVVLTIDASGRLSRVGPGTPGAVPHDLAPSVAFHPSGRFAYVTSGRDVWRVDLETGVSDRFALGREGSELTNPAVSASGTRLYAVEDGARLVRALLDVSGRPSVLDRVTLEATLDPAAPRVAYDAAGLRMWAADGGVVRQYSLFTGAVDAVSEPREIGRDVVLVAPGMLAALPEGEGAVVFYSLSGGTLEVVGEAAVPAGPFAPLGGGSPAADAATGALFVPLAGARSVLSLRPGGEAVVLDGAAAAYHLGFSAPLPQLVYADVTRFPGSVVIGVYPRFSSDCC